MKRKGLTGIPEMWLLMAMATASDIALSKPPADAPLETASANAGPADDAANEGSRAISAGGTGSLDATELASARPIEDEDDGELTTVVITGTNLRNPNAVIVPVIALEAEDLQKSGVGTNILDALRKSIPAFEGRSNTGSANASNGSQFTAGGSSIQLRNFPTLVLINGRRAAISAAAGVLSGKNFVDVNQIPLSAIARIDVLTDGASSIYGSDAIGGVVNIILKSNYEGLSVDARMAGAAGDYSEQSVSLAAGHQFGPFNLTLLASTNRTSPLRQTDRPFSSPLFNISSALPGAVGNGTARLADGLSSPSQRNPVGTAATATSLASLISNGTYVATSPAALSAGFDASQYQTLLLEQDNRAIALPFTGDFGNVEVFGDAGFSLNKSSTRWLPVAVTGLTVPAGSPFNPLRVNFTGVTFSALPIAREFFNESTAARISLGARGDFAEDWPWETGATYSWNELKQTQPGLIYLPNLSRAIAGGFDASGNAVPGGAFSRVYSDYSINNPLVLQPALDPFAVAAGLNPAALANVFGAEIIEAKSTLLSIDAKVSGALFSLPAGRIDVALGVGARKESISSHPDPNGRVSDPATGLPGGNSQNWASGIFFDPFSAQRKVYAAFAEARLPITSESWGVRGLRELDLIAAGRFEHYTDAGDSLSPKVGLRWHPFDRQIAVRASYSKSFAAPSLYFEFSPPRISRTGPTLLAGAFGASFSGMPYNSVSVGNPDLEPTRSTSKLVGVTLRPDFVPGLTLAADYVDIELYDFPGSLTQATVLQSVNSLGEASPYFQSVSIDAPRGAPGASHPFVNPGDLLRFLTNPMTGAGDPAQALRLYNADGLRNLATVNAKSITVTGQYHFESAVAGNFRLTTVAAILTEYDFIAVTGVPGIELAGHSTSSSQFAGTLPKYSIRSSLDWNLGKLGLTLGNTFVSKTTDTGPAGNATPEIPVRQYVAWDARLGYAFETPASRKLNFAVGVNNLADEMPPLAMRAFPDTAADTSTFSPIGRFYYGSISVEF
jgi:iron complex outermembrane recepter protein